MMAATNIAYYERERRGFLTQIAISLGFTPAAVVAFLVMLGLGVAVPLVLQFLPLGPAAATAILVFRLGKARGAQAPNSNAGLGANCAARRGRQTPAGCRQNV